MGVPKKKILVVDSDEIILSSLSGFLSSEGFKTVQAGNIAQARQALGNEDFALVVMDLNLPDGDGFGLLDEITGNYPHTVVIVITNYGTIESAVSAIKRGAYEYLTKPIADDELRVTVERAARQHELIIENESLRSQLEHQYSLENILSQNYKMAKIFDLVEAVADSRTTVLMTGPSGTGKTVLARTIHQRSSRRDKRFVEVSCGALPETLLESELFGYAKGAFTGADGDKQGKFVAANGGTIFLDEIGNASPAFQVKLLHVLQDRQFEPLGSNRTMTVDVRVILATNQDLKEKVRQGEFREDLYYRINVVNIELPPLRERVGDVELLAKHFMRKSCSLHNRQKLGITEDAISLLERYQWPGNVRELENVIERAVVLSRGSYIDVDSLPDSIKYQQNVKEQGFKSMSLKKALAEPEKQIIRQALDSNGWNRQKTAKSLDINRTTLFKKMKQYGLYEEAEKLGLL